MFIDMYKTTKDAGRKQREWTLRVTASLPQQLLNLTAMAEGRFITEPGVDKVARKQLFTISRITKSTGLPWLLLVLLVTVRGRSTGWMGLCCQDFPACAEQLSSGSTKARKGDQPVHQRSRKRRSCWHLKPKVALGQKGFSALTASVRC